MLVDREAGGGYLGTGTFVIGEQKLETIFYWMGVSVSVAKNLGPPLCVEKVSSHLDPYWEPCQDLAYGSKSSR